MYCEIHDIFWDFKLSSWFCPLCVLDYHEQMEDMVAAVAEIRKNKMNKLIKE